VNFCLCCTKNNNENDSHEIPYSVDSVTIYSKDRLLDLKTHLSTSDINYDESAIYLYKSFDHSIDVVNLDNYQIANNYPFEMEGPDGTGKHVNYINTLDEDLIFIKSFGKSGVFNLDGSLSKKVDWVNATDSKGLKFGEIPQKEIAIGTNDLKVYGLNYDQKNRDIFLDVLSIEENTVKRFDFDKEKSYHNFVLTFDNTFLDPIVYLTSENNNILISHQFSNEIYVFNSEGEQTQTVHYQPNLTIKRAKDLSGIKITSFEQIQNEYQELLEQIRFGPPVWDTKKNRYLRLSAKRVFSESRAENSLLPEIQEVKVYLTIFDEAFNIISESAIPELRTEAVKYFAKDGKLWVFKNFSDELGFIVIDI